MKHTEGRLSIDPTGDCGDWYIGNADIMVAECICDDFDADAEAINAANARRLVACWNALEGISTEQIESGDFKLVPALTSLNTSSLASV